MCYGARINSMFVPIILLQYVHIIMSLSKMAVKQHVTGDRGFQCERVAVPRDTVIEEYSVQ